VKRNCWIYHWAKISCVVFIVCIVISEVYVETFEQNIYIV